jgi:hypothetical protein
VRFGAPFGAQASVAGLSRRQAIGEVTRRIERSIRGLVAEAHSQGELEALRALRVVYDQERGSPPPRTLAERNRRDRRMAHWLEELRTKAPGEVDGLRADADAYLRALGLAGLSPASVGTRYTPGRVLRFVLTQLPLLLLVGPLAMVAALVTWPVRWAGDIVALRAYGGAEDVRAFCRIIGIGLVLVGVMALGGTLAGLLCGWPWALAVVVGLPAALALHLWWRDRGHEIRSRARAFFLLAGAKLRRTLLAQRHALHERMLAAGARL